MTPNQRLTGILVTIGCILLLPLVAMQFTNEVNWTTSDFIIMGILLLTTGPLCEFILRRVTSLRFRLGLCLLILFLSFLIWAELAVGIFGTPFAGS
ncbi:hypothetical protein [Robertkochia aurantiaca]|uniref:hypothetical protein n=1 Tax=Robertkochia aurantiaca TaxID=2873700 RepID=UPI001CCC74F8|nr:hypothetical protein [Robertkochia sp. 3YJGBD-33]